MDASIRDNAEEARKIAAMDPEIDRQYYHIYQMIVEIMKRETDTAVAAMSYLMVARILERIGDHIVNLCEWVVYDETGELQELNPGKLNRDEYLKAEEHEALIRHERKMARIRKEKDSKD